MIIGAIDPGYGTGYALYNTDRSLFEAWETDNGAINLDDFMFCDVVVCESYTITEITSKYTQQHDALNHIGFVNQFCLEREIGVVMQQPSAKKFGKQNKWNMLRRLDWYTKTKDDHQADAAAHLLAYLLKHRLLSADEMSKIKGALK